MPFILPEWMPGSFQGLEMNGAFKKKKTPTWCILVKVLFLAFVKLSGVADW